MQDVMEKVFGAGGGHVGRRYEEVQMFTEILRAKVRKHGAQL
jgi:hypothetical protein